MRTIVCDACGAQINDDQTVVVHVSNGIDFMEHWDVCPDCWGYIRAAHLEPDDIDDERPYIEPIDPVDEQ